MPEPVSSAALAHCGAVVELVEVASRDGGEGLPILPNVVRINGREVLVAADGIRLAFDESVPTVTLTLLPSEVHIRREVEVSA